MSKSPLEEATKETLQNAVKNRWLSLLVRVGYVAKAVVYFSLGIFAVQLGLRLRNSPVGQIAALLSIESYPFGWALLWGLLIGLAGYSLWGFVRAFFDVLDQRFSTPPLYRRLGYLLSAVAYGLIALPLAVFLLQGRETEPGASGRALAAPLLGLPFGGVILELAGITGVGIGLGQIYLAFRPALDLGLGFPVEKVSRQKWLVRVGRAGIITRGVVIALTGLSFMDAAYQDNPAKALSLTGAIYQLLWRPYGEIWLLFAGAGLILFGLYSLWLFFWLRLPWESL